jgi:hypothetical protein
MMRKYLVISMVVIFLMPGTGYGSGKIIGTQSAENMQEIFLEKCETLRGVIGKIAVFLVLIYASVECWSKRSSMNFSASFKF